MCESRQTSSPHNRGDNRVWRHSAPPLFRPRPSPPPCASPYELYNFRANHAPCADRGPERLRVVARGLAHPPPCRYVGTYDHRAEPAKFEVETLAKYTEWSVMVEPRKQIFPPHMSRRGSCACVMDDSAWEPQPLLLCGGMGTRPHACRDVGRCRHLDSPLRHRALEQDTVLPMLCACHP